MVSNRGQVVAVGLALSAGLLLVAWAATIGPTGVVSDGGYLNRAPALPTPTPTPQPQPQGQGSPLGAHHATHPLLTTSRMSELLTAVLVLAVFWLFWHFRRDLRLPRRSRRKEPRIAPEADLVALPEEERSRDSVLRTREQQVQALLQGSPRNGIVACWVLLEEAAARAGVARDLAETPMEFTTRFLHRLDVDPRAAAGLAGLYHEARFSSHELDESCRARARTALESIHADLATVRRASRRAS